MVTRLFDKTSFQTLSTPHFYFSPTADLSHSLQRRLAHNPEAFTCHAPDLMDLFTKWDQRFIWNRHLLTRYVGRG